MTRIIIRTITIIASISAIALSAFAMNARLPVDGSGKHPVQGYAPQSQLTPKTTSAVLNSYKNFSTSGYAAVKCTSRTAAGSSAAGTLTPVKVRVGGFATGSETDIYVTAEDIYWNPPAKIGFATYSGAVTVNCTKQPTQ